MLTTDESAPDFELPNQDDEPVRLSDFEGQRVVLYFYPKAGTEGCRTEACSFRDAWGEFEENDVQVLGISTDPVSEIRAFKEENDLPFPLLSDKHGEVSSAYESFDTTEVDGETLEIARRNTYVIDQDGNIDAVYRDVSPESHVDEILENF